MKKILVSLLIISILTISCMSTLASPQPQVRVFIDGLQVYLEEQPVNYNGRMYLKAGILSGMLGINYIYNPMDSSVTVISGKDFLSSKLGSDIVVKNSVPLTGVGGLATIIEGSVMFSIRNVAECIGKRVEWNDTEKIISISDVTVSDSNKNNADTTYPACDIPDFGAYSNTNCDFSESITEADGSTTYTYKYIVSRYNMYSSGQVQNYLNELIRLGWATDGKKYENPDENMMYYYFEKNNCHASIALMRDAAENIYTLWVTYTVY